MKRLALAVALAGGLLAGCGAGPTDEAARAAGITPPDVLAFMSVSLDPSIDQKRNLLSIAEAFPKAEVKDEFDESREEILRDISEQAGLDYETQVEPVLGDEIAVALFPPDGAVDEDWEPQAALIIEIDDQETAQKLAAEESDLAAYRIVGDHLLATEPGPDADAIFDRFSARSEGGGLSAKPEFERLAGELHGDRLVLGWVDVPRLVDLGRDQADSEIFGGFDPWESLGTAGPAAFDLHVENQSIVFEAVATATGDQKGARPVLTEGLPAGILGAMTVFDLESALGDFIEGFTEELGQESGVNDLSDELGLDPQRDILSWWGGETVLAVGAVNPETGFPDAALIVEPSDRAAAEAAIPKLIAAAEEATGPLTRLEVDGHTVHAITEAEEGFRPAFGLLSDRFVLATSPDYLEAVAEEASSPLSESGPYESVIDPDTSGATQSQLVIDIDQVREALENAFGMAEDEDYIRDTKPNIEPFDMLGMRAARIGDLNRFRVELTVS